jgi:hypothetical protein
MKAYPPKKGQVKEHVVMKEHKMKVTSKEHEMKKEHRMQDPKMRHMDSAFERETERRDRERNHTELDKSSMDKAYLGHCGRKKDCRM